MIPLEHVQDGDWAALNRVVDRLRSLVPDTGGVSLGIRMGVSTVTITNGTSANSASIPHGLGKIPANVQATARQTADTRDDYIADVKSRDATNIVVSIRAGAAESFPVTNPTTVTFDWVVRG